MDRRNFLKLFSAVAASLGLSPVAAGSDVNESGAFDLALDTIDPQAVSAVMRIYGYEFSAGVREPVLLAELPPMRMTLKETPKGKLLACASGRLPYTLVLRSGKACYGELEISYEEHREHKTFPISGIPGAEGLVLDHRYLREGATFTLTSIAVGRRSVLL